MTTPDPITGRPAAISRLCAGASRLLCSGLLCAAALPAFAQPAVPASQTTGAAPTFVVSTAATAAAAVASDADAMPMPERALLLAGDLHRLVEPQLPTGDSKDAPVAGSRIQSVLKRALALLGTPYRWGGTTTSGFDCSGLVGYVFRTTLGIELPRVSREMASTGKAVADRAELSPGDLVFFGRKGRVSHVGIYVGDGRFVHAPSTGGTVRLDRLDGLYWRDHYSGAKRVL